jgi:uncharacterized lipoprotein YddW (UPF0748 family)
VVIYNNPYDRFLKLGLNFAVMTMRHVNIILPLIIAILVSEGCKSIKNISQTKKTTETIAVTKEVPREIPKPKDSVIRLPITKEVEPSPVEMPNNVTMREFRAAWIATVDNIDWPSKPGLSSYEQKAEAIELLDFLKKNQFNAVILQVRPQADALYNSEIEPWSYFLTGEQGTPPEPYYDPLSFWIEEAHKRGLELHAWLNPYRAHHLKGNTISPKSVVKKNPDAVYKLQSGYWWMDPSLKKTQDLTSSVVMDIVKRYDVDGIHFDDYFYPYPDYNGGKDFPDLKSWNNYVKNGGTLSKGDWRRNAVNTLIERLYTEIKAEKKYVKFGLSPFGIYRPGIPSTVKGFDQYDKLYADAKLWLNKGWIDYMAPQLYWPINKDGQRFPDLLTWWQSENTLQRHMWPGINVVNKAPTIETNQEVLNEILLTRVLIPNSVGTVHWNLSSLTKNPTLAKELFDGPYKKQALVPASPWLGSFKPAVPEVSMNKNSSLISIEWKTNDKNVFKWILYYQYTDKWEYKIFSHDETKFELIQKAFDISGKENNLKKIIVTSIDRLGNESQQKIIQVN